MTEDKFIRFLEDNPKLFVIAKSEMCIKLLKILKTQALPLSEIHKQNFFSKFSDYDLEELLNVLCSLKLLEKERFSNRTIYSTNKNTDVFLNIYDDTKKSFNI